MVRQKSRTRLTLYGKTSRANILTMMFWYSGFEIYLASESCDQNQPENPPFPPSHASSPTYMKNQNTRHYASGSSILCESHTHTARANDQYDVKAYNYNGRQTRDA